MSEILKNFDELEFDVHKFLKKEKESASTFIDNLMSLGALLEEARDKWKPLEKWEEYLHKIDFSKTSAWRYISIRNKLLEDKSIIDRALLTNWRRVNAFLKLSEKQRDSFIALIQSYSPEVVDRKKFYEIIDVVLAEDVSAGEVEVSEESLDIEVDVDEKGVGDTGRHESPVVKLMEVFLGKDVDRKTLEKEVGNLVIYSNREGYGHYDEIMSWFNSFEKVIDFVNLSKNKSEVKMALLSISNFMTEKINNA